MFQDIDCHLRATKTYTKKIYYFLNFLNNLIYFYNIAIIISIQNIIKILKIILMNKIIKNKLKNVYVITYISILNLVINII